MQHDRAPHLPGGLPRPDPPRSFGRMNTLEGTRLPRFFILDAMNLAYRAYYAFVGRQLRSSRGEYSSVIYGMANTALKIRREERPEYWALAWDGPGPTHRHERYAEYKATRKPMPDDMLEQIPMIEDLASSLGLPVLEVPGAEADDVMATLAKRGERDGIDVVLVTGDKDMLQLVNEHVRVYAPVARGEDYTWTDRQAVIERWGVAPEQVGDVLALMGDLIDNVPGVHGVGEKTAVELIARFGSLEELYRRLDEVKKPALKRKLEEQREQAFLSRELVEMKVDLDLPYTWDQLRCAPIRRDALIAIAHRYELRRLEKIAMELGVGDADAGERSPGRTPASREITAERAARAVRSAGSSTMEPPPFAPGRGAPPPPPRIESESEILPAPDAAAATAEQESLDLFATPAAGPGIAAAALERRVEEIRARAIHGLAVLPLLAGDDPRTATLVGLGVAARDGTSVYVPLAHEPGGNVAQDRLREWFGPALADPDTPMIGADLKRDLHALGAAGFPMRGLGFDLGIGSFLCDPERDHTLEALARDVLGAALPPLEPPRTATRGRGSFAALPVESVAAWFERALPLMMPIADALRAQLEAREQFGLYERVEHPLIRVLHHMEATGVRVDRERLAGMSRVAGIEIARLESEIHELAGEPFNLNSGPQLGRVLFEKLALKTGRKTKTGFSTDQATLEELAKMHPLPAKLLEYRQITKLQSTYLDALPAVIDPRDGRVHTRYNQAGAATGRLSSSNPNLQNIPMRTARGREIRRAFVAPPGRVFVGGDYSQIELRVMAHLSGDPALAEAFRAGQDIHESTARRVFGIAEGPLDPLLRSRAKIVNFGVMYGMGARSLSEQMGLTLPEAQAFIANYFAVYARVREFLDGTLEDARRRGWVQTVLGRRRYLPALVSAHGGERSLAERAAINTPIQGSAADVMKLAMVHVHRALRHAFPAARLLLQVHDELLVECDAAEADGVSDLVRAQMASCIELRVPLEVSMGRGASWFDVH